MFSSINIISLAFFIAFILYTLMAFYLIVFDFKSSVNKVFSFTLISLSIWAFAYSYGIRANTEELAYFYRKLAALGWVNTFPLLVSTCLRLLLPKKDKKSNRNAIFIYTPSAILTYCLCFNDSISKQYINIRRTPLGWQNFGDSVFMRNLVCLYTVTYVLTAVFLLMRWRTRTVVKKEKHQALLMSLGIISTMGYGFYTDIIGALYFKRVSAEVAGITALFPMFLIWYAIVKYRVIPISINDISADMVMNMNEGLIVINEDYVIYDVNKNATKILKTEAKHLKGRHFTTLFKEREIESIKYFPMKSEIENPKKLNFSANIEQYIYGNYNNKIPVIMSYATMYDKWGDFVGGCIVFTDITENIAITENLNKAHENLELKITEKTSELNNSNLKLLSEIANREFNIKWEKLVSKISRSFVTINSSNINKKMNRMFENTALHFELDKAQLYIYDKENNLLQLKSQWLNYNIDSSKYISTVIDPKMYNWAFNEIKNGYIIISDVDNLPEEAIAEKTVLKELNIKSVIALPLYHGDNLMGICRFDSIGRKVNWSDEKVKMISILTNILVDGIIKIESEKKILQLAYYDALTKLPNRAKIKDIIDKQIYDTAHGHYFGILLLNIDYFKNIKESLGVESANIAIQIIAKSLCAIVDDSNYVGRFDDDEFVVLFINLESETEFRSKIEEVYSLFQKVISINNQELNITASIGASIYPTDAKNTDELIKNADIAMHKSKNLGKNRYTISSEELREEIKRKTKLSNDLYNAIDNNELYLLYQPQIDIKTRKIIGTEALLRWNHSELGVIAPLEFIPIAESTGLIISIGEWVLREAIRQAKEWQDNYFADLKISVNLSLSQFISENLSQLINSIILENEFEAEKLELEITESIAMDENSNILSSLHEFKKMGIKIAMDDFGTQYSSLSRIRNMPIDTLKIAMEFVQSLEQNEKDREIANIIVNIGKNLNLNLIAEGVETDYQLNYLTKKSVDVIQGFYFYKPLTKDEVENLLSY